MEFDAKMDDKGVNLLDFEPINGRDRSRGRRTSLNRIGPPFTTTTPSSLKQAQNRLKAAISAERLKASNSIWREVPRANFNNKKGAERIEAPAASEEGAKRHRSALVSAETLKAEAESCYFCYCCMDYCDSEIHDCFANPAATIFPCSICSAKFGLFDQLQIHSRFKHQLEIRTLGSQHRFVPKVVSLPEATEN